MSNKLNEKVTEQKSGTNQHVHDGNDACDLGKGTGGLMLDTAEHKETMQLLLVLKHSYAFRKFI